MTYQPTAEQLEQWNAQAVDPITDDEAQLMFEEYIRTPAPPEYLTGNILKRMEEEEKRKQS